MEVPHEEVHYFLFSRPHGPALSRHFNVDETIDESLTVRDGDLLHAKCGYHPVVCSPGASFYPLTMMVGPYRRSAASIHPNGETLREWGDERSPQARNASIQRRRSQQFCEEVGQR